MDIAVVECTDLPPNVEFIEDRQGGVRTYYIRPGTRGALFALLPLFEHPAAVRNCA